MSSAVALKWIGKRGVILDVNWQDNRCSLLVTETCFSKNLI